MRTLKRYLITVAIFYMIAYWVGPWWALGLVAVQELISILILMRQEYLVTQAITQYIIDHPEVIAPRQPQPTDKDTQNEI